MNSAVVGRRRRSAVGRCDR
ncbi:uncharacterized protein G2W53_026533 [Senna tora]|uniref:Uncharacterized protein n=1 Tax=Senna tora TaxID=362788 RepID=A0A834TF90_9FABA|nr:uncharacterized protein G2W53_026533 [Senna tora]